MNFKKFISSVSAIAIAASAFAAMAVTANAKTYEPTAVTPGVEYRVQNNGDGTYTTTNNKTGGFSGIIADLSGLPDIDNATSVTVEFDTYVKASGGATAKLMYGVGDKRTRDLTAYSFINHIGQYRNYATGLATYFGSEDGSTYYVRNKSTNYAGNVANQTVHAKVELDRTAKKGKTTLTTTPGGGKVEAEFTTSEGLNLTVIEAVAWGDPSQTWITLKNVTVAYTVPDPTPVAAGEVASFGNDEGACVYSATVTNDATYQAETVKAVATAVGGATAEDSASVSVAPGSALEIAVIVEGKTADEIESVTVSLY